MGARKTGMHRAILLSSSALFGWGSSRPAVSEHWKDAVHSTPAATPQSIAVLGATGRTGREFVAQALSRGHTVRALVRDPSKLTQVHPKLQVIKGDATDAAAVARTLQDVDCCVCTLGVGPTDQPTYVVSTAAKHVMKQPPARVIAVSSVGCNPKDPNLPALFRDPFAMFCLAQVHADLLRLEKSVMYGQSTKWTIVRAAELVMDKNPPTGLVKAGEGCPEEKGQVSYSNLALFMLVECVEAKKYPNAIVAVSE